MLTGESRVRYDGSLTEEKTLGIYLDPDTGRTISTHSMLKTFRRCPKQAEFKYIHRLKPKKLGSPLKRGTWIHLLLEVFSRALKDGAKHKDAVAAMWEAHQRLSKEFNALFDEEKDFYGDLPREIFRVMTAYLWHYSKHDWKVLDVEFVLEAELPDGSIFRAKVDLLVEDQFGLWIVDHKSHKTLPKLDYRILDAQSADYVWAALKNKIPVQGHIWNYIRWKEPSVPKMAYLGKANQRLSKAECDTDYPTYVAAVKQYQKEHGLKILPEYNAKAKYLKGLQYRFGEIQNSTFFRRDVLEKAPTMLNQVAREMYHTHTRMNEYPWDRPEMIERVPDRSCEFSCSYVDICTAQLWGGNIDPIIKRKYKVEDPMSYYYDEQEVTDGGRD